MPPTWRRIAFFDELPAPSGGGITWQVVSSATDAVAGAGYACNTSGAAFPLTLPAAPSAGDAIAVTDAVGTFDSNNLTVWRNGLKIMGLSEDMVVSTKYASFFLVYVDAFNGWRIA